MRTAYDSASATSVPAGADIYLGYIDGDYRSYPGMKARFPDKLVVAISVEPSGDQGTVFDGPPDNASWPQVVGWVVRRRAAGVDPTVYCSLSQWQAGLAAFRAQGVGYPHWWIAQWDGVANLIAGTVAKQYNSLGNRYDTSVVADYWPGVDPAPASGGGTTPTPAPPVGLEEDMALLISVTPDPTGPAGGSGAGIFLVSGAIVAHVPDPASLGSLQNAGLKVAVVSPAMYQNLASASSGLQGALSGSLAVTGNLNVGTPAA